MTFTSSISSPTDLAETREVQNKWGWIVAFGVLLSFAGLVALGSVLLATLSTVLVVGIAMIVAGVGEIVNGFAMRCWKKFFLWVVIGILYVIAGVSVFENPLLAAGILTLVLGAGLLVSGLVRFFFAFQLPENSPKFLVAASGLLTLVVGVIILAQWPTSSLWVIGTFLGIDLLFAGASWIGVGFALRRNSATA
jgi:aquaporin Z